MSPFAYRVFCGTLLLTGPLLAACSRDVTPTMEEGLVGRWEWQQSTADSQPAFTPINTGHRVIVDFDRRGRARFYQDGKLVSAAIFKVRRAGMGFGEPARHFITYRGYQVSQYYSVAGNRLKLQDTNGKLATHDYIRLISDEKDEPEAGVSLKVRTVQD